MFTVGDTGPWKKQVLLTASTMWYELTPLKEKSSSEGRGLMYNLLSCSPITFPFGLNLLVCRTRLIRCSSAHCDEEWDCVCMHNVCNISGTLEKLQMCGECNCCHWNKNSNKQEDFKKKIHYTCLTLPLKSGPSEKPMILIFSGKKKSYSALHYIALKKIFFFTFYNRMWCFLVHARNPEDSTATPVIVNNRQGKHVDQNQVSSPTFSQSRAHMGLNKLKSCPGRIPSQLQELCRLISTQMNLMLVLCENKNKS